MVIRQLLRTVFRRPQGSEADTLVEPLVLAVLLLIVVAGSVSLLNIANRSFGTSRDTSDVDNAIDLNLDEALALSERFTCCSGTCKIGPPNANEVGSSRSCATADPNDDNYFFPQQDDRNTDLIEPRAVDAICSSENNTAFLQPLKNAIDALPNPRFGNRNALAAIRTSEIQPDHVLQLTFTAPGTGGRVLHVTTIVPPMAAWCP